MVTVRVDGLADLPLAAAAVAPLLRERPVAALYGAMGAGKTTLVREICALLGVADNVVSPTFAIINRYCAGDGSCVNHFDLYRLARIEEALDIGCEEYLDSGEICLIEWPELIEGLLPDDVLRVHMEVTGEQDRKIVIK
ncbi:MAG: tRNA (adenosine(37)-N6)-threonylcarbamoyltransferase complex ATPase subunit type 1 TsaE [Rikenellaceae bacterium]|jgi:tRNA threonylcarbamoyladenosine biosynthesis protein TsaE|nr:tRNA (adenosine(37)-N6)-threonylcarbamoyltransferase complex ATPase subunit type 1 TsaE [Rikenellaceae bacterium]